MINRYGYYEKLKALAREVRAEYALDSPRVLRSDIKRIYSDKGIRLDYWPYRLKHLRGAYFNDEDGVTIMIRKDLPSDPMVFTMAHELKHHLTDSQLGMVNCLEKAVAEPVEIGAEVFAAEFLLPDAIFAMLMEEMGVDRGECTAESIVRIKHDTKTTLSYAGLVKKAEWLGFAPEQSLPRSGWKRLEQQIYGVPFYKLRFKQRD